MKLRGMVTKKQLSTVRKCACGVMYKMIQNGLHTLRAFDDTKEYKNNNNANFVN